MNHHSSRRGAKKKPAPEAAGPATAAANGGGKRERILDAAVRVFAQEGFYNAKVSQIAQVAGVADGTIYLYFKSKDELLISLFEDRMENVNANLREAIASESTARDRLKRVIRLHLELVQQNRHMAEVICVELRQSSKFIKEYANPKFGEFLRLIAGAVEAGQKSGELRPDIDPQLVARSLFGALDEISLAWLVRGGKSPDKDLSRAITQLGHLFIDGLSARKGVEP
jgi:TetR/AcrR family transcriptional regulator, fatty acid metabolism regulator protein